MFSCSRSLTTSSNSWPRRGWVNGCVPASASPTFLPGPRRLVSRCVNIVLSDVIALFELLSHHLSYCQRSRNLSVTESPSMA